MTEELPDLERAIQQLHEQDISAGMETSVAAGMRVPHATFRQLTARPLAHTKHAELRSGFLHYFNDLEETYKPAVNSFGENGPKREVF